MIPAKSKPKNVTEYINSVPKGARVRLRQMRGIIQASAPKAVESIKWGMPAFSYHRILVMYGAFKHHIGLYPTPGPIRKFTKDLKKYRSATGSIQFPLDKPLPVGLIQKIVRFRVKESLERDRKWKL